GTPTTLYAGTSDGLVFKSDDGGTSWKALLPDLPPVSVLVLDPTNPAKLYAGTTAGVFAIEQRPPGTTTTTQPFYPSSTTTTLPPGSGCDELGGFDGMRCMCRQGPATAVCAGQRVPAIIGRGFTRACVTVEELAAARPGRRARRLSRRAARIFDRIDGVATRRHTVRRLSLECAAALSSTLEDARILAHTLSR
ncbi:MAG: WD40/YVTN/BNR-like repeat-containing protein, partial [Candidatus Binatia bacterium]